MARMTKAENEERDQSLATLREALKPGDTVYTILKHVSRSGMLREIQCIVTDKRDGQPWDITYFVARVLREKIGPHYGVRVQGCGMDMGFATVYNLSRCLYPDGFGHVMYKSPTSRTGTLPRTKAEAEKLYAKGYRAREGRNGDCSGWDDDSGYALERRWF